MIRHESLMISPKILEQHGITANILEQKWGEMVVTAGDTYHAVINPENVYGVAKNYAPLATRERLLGGGLDGYRFCTEKCGGNRPLRLDDLF